MEDEMKRAGRVLVFTAGIIALSLILGVATSHSVRAAVSALVTVANTAANPVPTQSVDAKNAFQADLTMGFGSQNVAIPAGQRLVVDFVAVNGEVNSLQGAIQPSVLLQSTLNGGNAATYYLEPGPSPVNIPGENQLSLMQPVKVYADTLNVTTAYAGYAPFTFILHIAISGHLIPIS
jgi:hypothetical protein